MNLATLADVKRWLQSQSAQIGTGDDILLNMLLTGVSGTLLGIMSRKVLLKKTITDTFDGFNGTSVLLREWPVLSVSSVVIDGLVVPPSLSSTQSGWVYETWDNTLPGHQQQLSLRGFCFNRGKLNCQILYSAGYSISNEAQTVAGNSATVGAPDGPWAQDDGVTYANGTPLTKVSGAPGVGQYQLDAATPGKYNFNVGDNNQSVLISYSYIPAPLNEACVNVVGERYRYKDRIGQMSRSVGGQETTAFSQKDVPDYVRLGLRQFSRVVPW